MRHLPRTSLALLLLVALAAPLAFPARGDIVHLATGRKIEGKVVSEDAEWVRIETKAGVQTIAREDVVKIEKIADPKADFAARRKALEAQKGSAKQWFDLGLWAEDKSLAAEAKLCFEKAVAADPDHAGARQKLGHEKVGGTWLPFAEAQKRKGLVEHEGRWVKPEEKQKLEQGYVQDWDGSWVKKEVLEARKREEEEKARRAREAEREAARLRREREREKAELEGRPPPAEEAGDGGEPGGAVAKLPPAKPGEPPTPEALAAMVDAQKARARGTEQVLGLKFEDVEEGPLLLHTTHAKTSEKLLKFLKDLGAIYKAETKIYNLPFEAPIWPGKLQIYFFKDKGQFDAFATQVDDAGGAVNSGGYFIQGGSSAGSYTKFHIAMYDLDLGTLAHEVSHAFMARYQYSERRVIPWANEGVAEFLRIYIAETLEMGQKDFRHRGMVKEMIARGDSRCDLKALFAKEEIAGTEGWAYAVSYTVIDFMVAVDKSKFVKFLKALKLQGDGTFRDKWTGASREEQIAAVEDAFGMPFDKFETGWKDYVRNYR
jgi:hypothetical protein